MSDSPAQSPSLFQQWRQWLGRNTPFPVPGGGSIAPALLGAGQSSPAPQSGSDTSTGLLPNFFRWYGRNGGIGGTAAGRAGAALSGVAERAAWGVLGVIFIIVGAVALARKG